MRRKHRYDFDDVSAIHYGSLFDPVDIAGTNGSGIERGLISGAEAFSYASRSGNLDGVDAARGTGCLLTYGSVLGDLDSLHDPAGDDPGGAFTLKRAIFSAAFHESVTFEVIGVTDGRQTHRQIHTVDSGRNRVEIDIRDVDYVTIQPVATGAMLPFEHAVGAYALYPLMIDSIVTRMAIDDALF
jgi:hypothetical protein